MQNDFRKKLIADHLEMAAAIAHDCVNRYNLASLLPYDDVLAYAQQGLVEAASRYSPESGTKFRSYSWPRIKGAVIDGVRKSRRYGFSRTFGAVEPDSHGLVSNDRSTTLDDLPDESATQQSAEEKVDATRLRSALLNAIATLPERHREITLRHYYRGEDLKEISKDSCLSEDHVGRIHTSSLRYLRATLEERLCDHVSPELAQ
jgi:RNA polymerase sigma factor for flagellar operon FliA